MGMNTSSAPPSLAAFSCTVKSVLVSSGKVCSATTSRPTSAAWEMKPWAMPVE